MAIVRNFFINLLWNKWLARVEFDVRGEEYRQSIRFLEDSEVILDVACGTGTFLEARVAAGGKSGKGIDQNPDNVEFAKKRGHDVEVGNALELPYESNSFDGAHCSHLMQVFDQDQAQKFIREICRVTKDGGVVVIITLNWFPRFFRHPENSRPYPPDAIWRYALQQNDSTSPMYDSMPNIIQEDIWFRRPPLLELISFSNMRLNSVFARLNALQLKWGVRKYWAFDAYIIKIRVKKS